MYFESEWSFVIKQSNKLFDEMVSSSSLGQMFNLPSTIYVRILRQGTTVASETRECYVGTTEIVTIKVDFIFLIFCQFKIFCQF